MRAQWVDFKMSQFIEDAFLELYSLAGYFLQSSGGRRQHQEYFLRHSTFNLFSAMAQNVAVQMFSSPTRSVFLLSLTVFAFFANNLEL